MSQARKDANHVSTMIGVSSVDGITPIRISVDPITGYLMVENVDISTLGAITVRSDARKDANHVSTILGTNGSNPQCLVTHNGYLALDMG